MATEGSWWLLPIPGESTGDLKAVADATGAGARLGRLVPGPHRLATLSLRDLVGSVCRDVVGEFGFSEQYRFSRQFRQAMCESAS